MKDEGSEVEAHLSSSHRTLSPLSRTAWRLLSCIWDLREANPPQVSEYFQNKFGEELNPKTAGIFLARLEDKGYLRSAPGPTRAGRGRPPHIYQAVIAREESLGWQLEKFLDDHLIDADSLEFLVTLLSRQKEQVELSRPGPDRLNP